MALQTYAVLYLLEHTEYSIREYAELALNHLLSIMCNQPDSSLSLFKIVENKVLGLLRKTRDEMIMRTLLSVLRTLVITA